ncbi:uncharacterized protein LOC142338661 isoform X2 [Convolutriloba macropyga]|uniref:uncharacterized protein LOC142338661 isoform X2 n=1 Tax=Convolutriloba macropyga TaxID=536237 RepID=UPI003F5231BE
MSFLKRKTQKSKKGEIDHALDPFSLKVSQVKHLNKKVELKSHFVGFVNLVEGDFCDLLINTIEANLRELTPESGKSQSVKVNDTKADCELLLCENDDSDSEDDDLLDGHASSLDSDRTAREPGTSSSKKSAAVFDFSFAQVTMNCLVAGNPADPITASLDLIKRLLSKNHWFCELDMDGTYLFKALLPTKQTDFAYRIQHWLSGLIVVTNHQYNDPTEHFNCIELAKKLNDLRQVLRQSYVANNVFQKSSTDFRKTLLVFMNPAGICPEMCPANRNLENAIKPCLTCLELKTNFDCKFASDLTAAFTILMDQDVYKIYPDVVRLVNMQLSGLY